MIKLYFINNSGKGRSKQFIHNYSTVPECMLAVNNYIKVNNLTNIAPCMHFWITEDIELMIDYGSHSKFFKLKPTCEKSKKILQKWIYEGE